MPHQNQSHLLSIARCSVLCITLLSLPLIANARQDSSPEALKRTEENIVYYQKKLAAAQSMYKDGDYKLGKAFEALGGMLQVGQRHEEAIQNFKAALKIFLAQTPSSKTQWKILSTRTSIGKSLYSLGKYKEAAVVLEDSLHGHLDPNGKHYAYVETMLEYLAWAYHKAGVHEEALKYCKIYLDNVRELGREDDHFSTPVRFLYGESLNSLGRHQQAITQYEKVLAFYRRWIPEDHPNIAQVKGRLMAAQKAFSNHEKGN